MWQEIVNVYRDFDTFGKIDMLILALLSIYCWCFFVFKYVGFGKLEEANAQLAKRLSFRLSTAHKKVDKPFFG